MPMLKKLLTIAIESAIEAGKAIMEIYDKSDYSKVSKSDNSPLTEADLISNTIINAYLEKTGYPIISEENSNKDFSERKSWKYCWIVDPLDGTKEFIKRNDEFTVNIAFCEDGVPLLGVIYVPATQELYFGIVPDSKAYKKIMISDQLLITNLINAEHRIYPSKEIGKSLLVVASRSHISQETLDFIATKEEIHEQVEIVSKGSSLKFCMVAEGKADIYPRFAPTMEWDTAAGQAICMSVGLKVVSTETGQMLTYNKQNLLNPSFLVGR